MGWVAPRLRCPVHLGGGTPAPKSGLRDATLDEGAALLPRHFATAVAVATGCTRQSSLGHIARAVAHRVLAGEWPVGGGAPQHAGWVADTGALLLQREGMALLQLEAVGRRK